MVRTKKVLIQKITGTIISLVSAQHKLMLVILQFFSKVNIQQACVCVQVCTGVYRCVSVVPQITKQDSPVSYFLLCRSCLCENDCMQEFSPISVYLFSVELYVDIFQMMKNKYNLTLQMIKNKYKSISGCCISLPLPLEG